MKPVGPFPCSLALLVGVALSAPDLAAAQQELFKLTARDGAPGDNLSRTVCISGERVVVGSFYDDDLGADSGSAYVFDATSGRGLFKLKALDGAPDDSFGWSVAISGTRAIIGAIGDDENGINSGSAYVFDVTTGQELFKLTASDGAAGDQFGLSVAISGGRAIAGADRDDDLGEDSGSAYVFLTPEEGTSFCFGDGSGTLCACGNRGVTGEGCANSGGAGGCSPPAVRTVWRPMT